MAASTFRGGLKQRCQKGWEENSNLLWASIFLSLSGTLRGQGVLLALRGKRELEKKTLLSDQADKDHFVRLTMK